MARKGSNRWRGTPSCSIRTSWLPFVAGCDVPRPIPIRSRSNCRPSESLHEPFAGSPGQLPAQGPPKGPYNRYRYFDPRSSTYISRDPIRLMGGEQLYGYCRDPLISIDPLGLSSRSDYDRGISFFGKDVLRFVDRPDATLGPPGGVAFVMPIEDAAKLRNTGDIARHTGMAPTNQKAHLAGENICGVSVPLADKHVRPPTAEDAGGFIHFLAGGTTAVRLPGEHGGYLKNSTRELVTAGGSPMPPGSVLFEVDNNGTWIPIRRF